MALRPLLPLLAALGAGAARQAGADAEGHMLPLGAEHLLPLGADYLADLSAPVHSDPADSLAASRQEVPCCQSGGLHDWPTGGDLPEP
jgi:hypothetical protein